ncbi:hypothetical protein CRG98_035533 [Punica granatum]|uniref:Uncharacterized protein n=1 Tax=Punica granatum TaxID=22663 RepID=A0A2I0IJ62_PUNGR|nr:hypothetical protein CRG98_035533 [Punica granatum]
MSGARPLKPAGWSRRAKILEPIIVGRSPKRGNSSMLRLISQAGKLEPVGTGCEGVEVNLAHLSRSKSLARRLEPVETECEGAGDSSPLYSVEVPGEETPASRYEVRLLEPVGTELAVCRPEFVSSRLACVRTYHTA